MRLLNLGRWVQIAVPYHTLHSDVEADDENVHPQNKVKRI